MLEQALKRKTFLGGLTTFLGFKLASMYTISWSEIPGITSILFISELLLVKNKSSVDSEVAAICVGLVTTCSK